MSFFRTVKFRMTLQYAILFSVSSAILFAIVYSRQHKAMENEVDQALTTLALKVEDRYLRGDDGDDDDPTLALSKIPQQVKKSLNKRFPGFKIRHVRLEGHDRKSLYEIIGNQDTQIYEIEIDADGKIVKVEKERVEHDRQFLQNVVIDEINYMGNNQVFCLLHKEDDSLLARSDLSAWKGLEEDLKDKSSLKAEFSTIKVSGRQGNVRLMTRALFDGSSIQAGYYLRDRERILKSYRSVYMWIFFPVLILGSMTGWFLSSRTMKGVNRVRETAVNITRGEFDSRVPIGSEGAEIESLAETFNVMIARVGTLIHEMTEVSDNIAHDLRTPLTRIQGIIETTVRANPDTTDYKVMSADVMEECGKLIGTINTMLEITRTDSGIVPMEKNQIVLNDLLQSANDHFKALADSNGLLLELSLPEEDAIFIGSKNRLQRVIGNLLDNAIKYTDEGEVCIKLQISRDGFDITVTDTGVGIAKAELAQIFDRFYRCDASRTRPGNGLGLSLAKAIVNAHNGEITVTSSSNGSVFCIHLPV